MGLTDQTQQATIVAIVPTKEITVSYVHIVNGMEVLGMLSIKVTEQQYEEFNRSLGRLP